MDDVESVVRQPAGKISYQHRLAEGDHAPKWSVTTSSGPIGFNDRVAAQMRDHARALLEYNLENLEPNLTRWEKVKSTACRLVGRDTTHLGRHMSEGKTKTEVWTRDDGTIREIRVDGHKMKDNAVTEQHQAAVNTLRAERRKPELMTRANIGMLWPDFSAYRGTGGKRSSGRRNSSRGLSIRPISSRKNRKAGKEKVHTVMNDNNDMASDLRQLEATNKMLLRQNDELREQAKRTNDIALENETLRGEIRDVRQELEEAKAHFATILNRKESELTQFAEANDVLTESLATLEGALNVARDSQAKVEGLEEELERIKEKHRLAKAQLVGDKQKVQEDNLGLKKQISELEAQVKRAEGDLLEARQSYSEQSRQLERALEVAKRKIAKTEEALGRERLHKTAAIQLSHSVGKTRDNQKKRIEEVEEQLAALERIRKKQAETFARQISQLKAQLAEKKVDAGQAERIRKLEAEVESLLQERMEALSRPSTIDLVELEEKDARIAELQMKLEAAWKTIEQLEGELVVAKGQTRIAFERLQGVLGEMTTLRSAKMLAEIEVKRKQAGFEARGKKIEALEDEIEAMNLGARRVENMAADEARGRRALKAALNAAEIELEKLRDANLAMEGELAALQKERRDERDEVRFFRKEAGLYREEKDFADRTYAEFSELADKAAAMRMKIAKYEDWLKAAKVEIESLRGNQ